MNESINKTARLLTSLLRKDYDMCEHLRAHINAGTTPDIIHHNDVEGVACCDKCNK